MEKPHEISDYRILGYSDKDKQELADRIKAIDISKIKKAQQAILNMGKIDWNDPILKQPMTI